MDDKPAEISGQRIVRMTTRETAQRSLLFDHKTAAL
jgi:hypothetical protein